MGTSRFINRLTQANGDGVSEPAATTLRVAIAGAVGSG